MPATLADVAQRAGVSVATASRVLNGSTRSVNAELRSRVLLAARELHYVPNAHAQALVRERSAIVGVIVHDVSDPYFAEITRGIQRSASAAHRLVMICNSYREPERELEYTRLLHAQRVEALIMAGSGLEDRAYSQALTAQVQAFTASGGQVAFIGRHAIPGSSVIPDNAGGARALARLLVELGHRAIGVISGPPLLTATHDRLSGFRRGLQELGLELPPERIAPGEFSRDGGLRATLDLLDRHPQLTAIFALNDLMAIGALAALRARGICVPHQISVVGFDDIPIAEDVTPALTTVRVPMVELGEHAVQLALAPPGSPFQLEYLPTEVVLRASMAPAAR
ncbi:MAG TPA: LacI family DNA-binding transcriptional regulator [Roseiflexaceae bacterium]|nr:LacI family DNA-binding transcriptional regulator [Roseiflexaceae bacterium]